MDATVEGMSKITSNDDNSNSSIPPYQAGRDQLEGNDLIRQSDESEAEDNEHL